MTEEYQQYLKPERQTMAQRYYSVLDVLYKSNEWENINVIARKANIPHSDRLKKELGNLVERKIIQSWTKVTDKEKKEIKKNQVKAIIRQNNYKITSKGREKFDKINDRCLDSDTRIIFRIRQQEQD